MSAQVLTHVAGDGCAAPTPAPAGTAPCSAEMPDERFAKRRSAATPAHITHQSLPQPLSVVVRDCSSTGAKLQLIAASGGPLPRHVDVPKQFTLSIPVDRSCVECEVAWHCGSLIGVRYISPTYLQPRPPRPRPAKLDKQGSLMQFLGFGSARSA